MLTWLLFTLLKYLLVAIAATVVYCLYIYIYKPYRTWSHFKKYDNVEVTSKFYPVLGNYALMKKRIQNKEYQFWDYNDTVINRPHKDMILFQFGTQCNVDLLTIRAVEEFDKLVPESIDRVEYPQGPIWYGTRGSILQMASTEYWKERRTSSIKLIGINQISCYLITMFQSCDMWLDSWKIDDPINFSSKCKSISFKVISRMMFGNDFDDQKAIMTYADMNSNQTVELVYEEFLVRMAKDVMVIFGTQLGNIFPFIQTYSLMNPYKSVMQNSITLYSAVRKYCDESKDENSLFNRLLKLGTIKREDIYWDIVGLIGAGMDTTADTISSTLYFLKKFPMVRAKLIEQLNNSGLDILKKKELKGEDMKDIHEKLLEWEYLNYVIKETLRIDSAGSWSIRYLANKDVKICGVDIPKDTVVRLYTVGPSQDPSQWHKPREYIPDRFNPESEYFFKPGQPGAVRNPKSWIPFSSGIRTWPGKALAIYEAKAIIARLMYNMEYDIDQDLINNDKVQFQMTSQFHVTGKVTQKQF